MLSWFQVLMPHEDRFFDLFNRHSLTIVEGSEALNALLSGKTEVYDACIR